jgi:hypothetical protein
MADDLWIPGDALTEAQGTLGIIRDFIDIGDNQFDFESAFGPELAIHGSAQNFENKWQDGQDQLIRGVKTLIKNISTVLEQMEKTDQDAAKSLQQE